MVSDVLDCYYMYSMFKSVCDEVVFPLGGQLK